MKLLFVMRHSGYVRNFESTLRMLCDRGHGVHIAFQGTVKYAQLDPADIARQLSEQYSNFSYGHIRLRADGWGLVGREMRLGLDYLRYLRPEYRNAPKLQERARRDAPPSVVDRTTRGLVSTAVGRQAVAAWLRGMNRAIPPDPEIDAFIRTAQPDVLAVTPLIEPGSPQAEFLRSARALGVRTAFCVASWDNLSNKGLIHGPVDLVTVWNEAMKREAIELHGMPAERVAVTGAVPFDHWFDWRPSTSREAFCSRAGLKADRPYVLYVCSSKFVAPEEVPFVRAWAEQIRHSTSPTLREAGLLVRPHPQHAEQWEKADVSSLGVVVWPAGGAAPVDTASRTDYYDSMYHSAAVVGVNTTAEIESAILGRPVYTMLAPEFRDTQEGTLHFHHLQEVDGGLLHVARDFEDHLVQLDAAVRQPDAVDPRCQRFVEAFVRPNGMDVPATPSLVAALETLASMPSPRPERAPVWASLVRPRLARRSARLEHEARTLPESFAAKLVAKAAREERRQLRETARREQRAEKARREADRTRQHLEQRAKRAEMDSVTRHEKLQALVAGFRGLGEVERRRFLHDIVECIPADSFIELHAAPKPRRLDYEAADIYLHVTTKGETLRLSACAKEPFTIDWIHSRIGAGDVLYDIGANVGAYSLVAAKKPGGRARVFSFEPSYASVASLCSNIVLNGVAGQVTPVPIALSDTTAMNVFSLRDLEPGSARHVLGHGSHEGQATLYEQPVLMCRLDDVVAWFGLPLPNHIKLDVDGGELAVLEGASRTLTSPTLRSMLIEISTSLSGAVTDVLERHGLRLESKISVTNKSGESAVWYGLFARDGAGGALTTSNRVEAVSR